MRRLLPVLVMALALVAASCSGGSDDPGPTDTTLDESPSTSEGEVTTTAPPTTDATPETTVSRGTPRTPTTLTTAIGPGDARLNGTVDGPDGPVTGAVVKIERFVGSEVATEQVETQNGRWQLSSILGGTYRVSASRPPDLVQLTPGAFFLRAGEAKTLDITLVRVGQSGVTATIEPSPPIVGQPALLRVRFGTTRVGPGGQVVTTPDRGVRAQLNLDTGIGLESAAVVLSDAGGEARWQVRCFLSGQHSASVNAGNASYSLLIPACVEAPAPGAPAGEPE